MGDDAVIVYCLFLLFHQSKKSNPVVSSVESSKVVGSAFVAAKVVRRTESHRDEIAKSCSGVFQLIFT